MLEGFQAVAARHQHALKRLRNARQILFRGNVGLRPIRARETARSTAVHEVYTSFSDPDAAHSARSPSRRRSWFRSHRSAPNRKTALNGCARRQSRSRRQERVMAEEKDFFQKLSGEMLDFFDLGRGHARRPPRARCGSFGTSAASRLTCRPRRPSRPTSSTLSRPISDASHPSAEAAISAIADIAVVARRDRRARSKPGRRASNLERKISGTALLEIMASNFVRLRWPRLFLLLQGVLQSKMPPRPSDLATTIWSASAHR